MRQFVTVVCAAVLSGCANNVKIGIQHDPPTVAIIEPADGATFVEGEDVVFRAKVQSRDTSDLTLLTSEWVSGSEIICELANLPPDGEPSCTHVFRESGQLTVEVNVVDPQGDRATTAVGVRIVPNDPPKLKMVAPADGSILPAQDMVVFEAEVSDPDQPADSLIVTGKSSIDGDLDFGNTPPDGDGNWVAAAQLSAGNHLMTFEVADELGKTDRETFQIQLNNVPSAPQINITPNPAASGEGLTANIAVPSVDLEGDSITYNYYWRLNGTDYPNPTFPSSNNAINPGVTQRGDYVEVAVTAYDGVGESNPGRANITIANSPPSIAACLINPSSPGGNDTLTAVPTGWTDADGDTESYTYRWLKFDLGQWVFVGITDPDLPNTFTSKGDIFSVECTPNDGFVDGPTVQSLSVTVSNAAPTLSACSIFPPSPDTTDDLTATPQGGADSDGDPITYSYAWYINNLLDPTEVAATLPAGKTTRDDEVRVECTPNDGTEDGQPSSSPLTTIENAAPTTPVIDIDPAVPVTGDRLEALIVTASTDPDGDAVSYQYSWFKDGQPFLNPTHPSLNPVISPNQTYRLEDWTVEVVATDFTDTSAPATDNVSIGNRPPILSSCLISPTQPGIDDDLTATPSGWSDPEGDPESYSYLWEVDNNQGGGFVTVQTGSSNTLNSTWVNIDDRIRVSCIPNDGFEDGAPAVSPIVAIGNSPPSINACSVAPLNADTLDDLVATPSGWVDADGDLPDYVYVWYVDGVPDNTVSGNVYPAANTTRDKTYAVDCLPDDGQGQGAPIRSSDVVVQNTAPTAPVVEISPNVPITDDAIQAALTTPSVDVDGDPITYTYYWTRNSTNYGNPTYPSANANIAANTLIRGEFWEVRVVPNDGDLDGPGGTSSATVGNGLPNLNACNINPPNPGSADVLTAEPAGWTDPENDAEGYRYRWYQDSAGTWVDLGVTTQTLPASQTVRGRVYRVTCTPDDGWGLGVPVDSPSVVVNNSAPTITGCAIGPAGAITTTVLNATPSGWTDADGDLPNYTYLWYRNGTLDTSENGPTFPTTKTQRDDVIRVECVPDDGAQTGTPLSSGDLTIQNASPTAPEIAIAPGAPRSGEALEATIVTASTDPDGDAVQYRYSFYRDGLGFPNPTLPSSNDTIVANTTARGEFWDVEVVATDAFGGTSLPGNDAVTIGNSAPSITGCEVTPNSPDTTETLTATPQGWFDYDLDPANYRYRWFIDNGGTWQDSGVTTATLDPSRTARGQTWRVQCTPVDPVEAGVTVDSVPVSVGNADPSIATCTLTPVSPKTGADIQVSATGWTDPDGDAPSVRYAWYKNTVADLTVNGNTYPSTSTAKGDEITVECTPDDGTSLGTTLSATPVTVQNTLPTQPVVSISPAAPLSGQALTANVDTAASDADNDGITYFYRWRRDSGQHPNPTYPSTNNGVAVGTTARGEFWEVDVIPNDGDGDGAAATVGVVIGNSIPSITGCTITPATPGTSDDLTANPQGWSDYDGDSAGYTYRWYLDVAGTWVDTGITDSTVSSAVTARGERYRVECTPTDGFDSGTTATSSPVVIVNKLPTLAGCSLAPNGPRTTNNLIATPSGWSDPDGDTQGVQYVWYVNSTVDPSVTSNTYPSANTKRDDAIRVDCVPFDGTAAGTPVPSNEETVVNSPPGAPTVQLLPTNPTTGDPLTADLTAVSVDADGDPITYSYYWRRDSIAYPNPSYPSPNDAIGGGIITNGDFWEVDVVPHDGFVDGQPGTASALVGASAPSITACNVSPVSPSTGDALTATPAGWFDADGDPEGYRFRWFRDTGSGFVDTGITTQTLPAAATARGEDYRAECTPDDGTATGSPVMSGTVTVGNTPPTITTCSLTPAAPFTNQGVTASFGGWSDPDGDPPAITRAWWVNNVLDAAETGTTYPASKTTKGDEIYVECTPNDGITNGTMVASSTVTIANSAPTAPIIDIAPSSPIAGDGLTANITTPSSDIDAGDTITYTFFWHRNGVDYPNPSYPSANDFINPGIVQEGDIWDVTVVPNDGDTDGPGGSDTVTTGNSPPSITACDIQPSNPVTSDDLVAVPGGWTDFDGDSPGYRYKWFVDGGGFWVDTGVTAATYPQASTTRGGIYRVQCTPDDGQTTGAPVDSTPVTVTNTPPEITTCDIGPVSPNTTQDVVVSTGGWVDPDGDAESIQIAWYVNNVLDSSETGTSYPASKTTKGQTVHAVCTPNDGAVNGTPLTSGAETVINSAPTAPVVTIVPAGPLAGQLLTATITTNSTDADGDGITYSYAWFVNGAPHANPTHPSANPEVASGVTARGEFWEVIVTPTDGTDPGPTATASVIPGNVPPTGTNCDVVPGTAKTGDDLVAIPSGWDDYDGDTENWRFRWFVDTGSGFVDTGKLTQTLAAAETARGNVYQVRCTPDDGIATGTAIDSAPVTIGNTRPIATTCTLNPAAPKTGQNLTAAASGWSDPDGDSPAYTYAWYVNSVLDSAVTGNSYPASNTSKDDEIYVECVPFDGIDSGPPTPSSPVTILNTLPTAPVITVTPDPASSGQILTANINSPSTDADNDAVTYRYFWRRDGASYGNPTYPSTNNTIAAGTTARGEFWEVDVVPNDGTGDGPGHTDGVVVGNSAPSITGCTIGPVGPGTSDDLVAQPSGWTDLDGDSPTYTYRWFEDIAGTWTDTGVTDPTLSSTITARGDRYRVECTPVDTFDAGNPVTSPPVTIVNKVPSLASCDLTPASPTTNNSLVVTAGGWNDPDGDAQAVQYVWYVNNVVDATETTNTYPSSKTSRDDDIRVECVPDDGTTTGAAVSSGTSTVINSPPGAPTITISPANPGSGDALTAQLTTPSVDADGDPITYTYQWRRDGTDYCNPSCPSTNNSISAGVTNNGEFWDVIVVPNDGFVDGAVGTASALVGNSAPSITSCNVSPVSPATGDDLTATPGGWSDAEGDPEGYRFRWFVDTGSGFVDAGITTQVLPSSATSRGEIYKVECTPDDGSATGAPIESGSVTVGNTLPTIAACNLTPASPATNQSITVSAAGWSDPDGDPPSIRFVWSVNGVVDAGETTNTYPAAKTVKGDDIDADCIPSDPSGDGPTVAATQITVVNTPPTAPTVEISPSGPLSGDGLTVAITTPSTDLDNDGITYLYYWHRDGNPYANPSFPSTNAFINANVIGKGEIWDVDVVPNDGDADGTAGSDTVSVGNSPPSMTQCDIQPTDPGTSDALTADPGGWLDYDGDAATYRYRWFVDNAGSWVNTGVTTATLPAGSTTRGATYRLECTPDDGTDTGAPLDSNPVTIGNTPPSITTCEIGPLAPKTAQNVVVSTGGWVDADSDPENIVISWWINGVEDTTETGTTYPAAKTDKDDTIFARCTPFDGIEAGTAMDSATETIVNTAPTQPVVTITPASPFAGDALTATLSTPSTDADGDPITYTYYWYVDSAPWGNPTHPSSNASIAADLTLRGEFWEVLVVPSDGTDNGPGGAANASPSNVPPTFTGCTIQPSNPDTTDDLVAVATGWDDYDGDAENYTYEWFVDTGSGYVSAGESGDTLSSLQTQTDAVYYVRCVPDDTIDLGIPIDSAPRTIANSPPTVGSCNLTPATPRTGDDLVAQPAGWSDADGDAPSYTFVWYVGGVEDTSVTSNTYPSGKTDADDDIYVECVPMDGSGPGTSLASSTITVQNTLPTAPVVTITPNPAASGELLTAVITTPSVDADGDTITYTYQWRREGTNYCNPSCPSNNNTIAAGTTARSEFWDVDVIPYDGTANGSSGTAGIVVGNSPPSITGCTINPVSPGTTDDLSAAPAGWYDADGDAAAYTYRWFKNVAGTWVDTGVTDATLTSATTARGDEYRVECTPFDTFDSGATVTSPSSIIVNKTPSLASCDLTPSGPVTTNNLVATPGGWSDADGDAQGVQYIWHKNGAVDPSETGSTYPSTKTTRNDDISVECVPYDGITTGSAVSSLEETVVNSPPGAPTITITPNNPGSGDALTANLATPSFDADGDPITYDYYWRVDTSPFLNPTYPTNNNVVAAGTTANGEFWEVEVVPNDGFVDGTGGVATALVGNSAPSITACNITPVTPSSDDDLTANPAGWFDADGDPEGYRFRWFVDTGSGFVDTGITTQTLPFAATARGEAYRVDCTPDDGSATGTPITSGTVNIANSAPTIATCSLTPGAPKTNQSITASYTGWSDDDGDPPLVNYTWYRNGVEDPGETGNTYPSTKTAKDDDIDVDCTPNDGFVNGPSLSATTVTIINSAPTAPVVEITPANPRAGQGLTVTITTASTDLDGDPITYQYYWHRDAVNFANPTYPSGNNFVGASITVRGETWDVAVVPNDGTVDGAAGADLDSIGNAIPSITSCEINPVNPQTADALTAVPGGWSDYDGDAAAYTYRWFKDNAGTWVDTGVTTATYPALSTSRSDKLKVQCTPNDGTDPGTTLDSPSVTVGNTPPEITGCLITPPSANTDDDLSAAPSGWSDADGDPQTVQYQWFVNGSEDLTETGAVYPAAKHSKDDDIDLTCTPFDGTATGAPLSATTRTILNTPPTAPVATLTASPRAGQPLTATITTPSTDADGDTVTYTYAWFRDGTPYANPTHPSSNATVAAGVTQRDEFWTVTITPNDGDEDGDSVTPGELVGNAIPSMTTCGIGPANPKTQDDLIANPSGFSDYDGDAPGYNYRWFKDVAGSWVDTGVTTVDFQGLSTLKGEKYRVECTPTDGNESGSPLNSATLTITNTAPVLAACDLSPTDPKTADDVVATPSGWSDDDGDAPGYNYVWRKNGSVVAVTGNTFPAAQHVKGDELTVACEPDDGTTTGPVVNSVPVTVLNTAPTAPVIALTSNPRSGEPLVASIVTPATDPDAADTITYSYSWFVNAVAHSNPTHPSTNNTIAVNTTQRGQFWDVDVVANDGTVNSAIANEGVTVANALPSITGVSLTPSTPITSQSITATPLSWQDYDGDFENYSSIRWFHNTVEDTAELTASFPSAKTSKGDTLRVEFTPYDGFDNGTTVTSATITVGNAKPTAPVVSVSPFPPAPDDDLLCNLDSLATDLDGDSLSYSYEWFNTAGAGPISGQVLTSGNTTLGEKWWCEAWAWDGTDNGAHGVALEVTIQDSSAPNPPVIDLPVPHRNETTVDLTGTCEANCDLTFYCNDGGGNFTETDTCSAGGTFTHTVNLAAPDTTSCYATCTDVSLNVSGDSNSVTTQTCGVTDDYESTGGDTAGDAVNAWTPIFDDGGTTINITGNILDDDPGDWYRIDSSDNVGADRIAGIDCYRFAVDVTGSAPYTVHVYRDGFDPSDLECTGQPNGYTQYDDYAEDLGEPEHAAPAERRSCGYAGDNSVNECNDLSAAYYIHVLRDPGAPFTCDSYTLSVTNGDWDGVAWDGGVCNP